MGPLPAAICQARLYSWSSTQRLPPRTSSELPCIQGFVLGHPSQSGRGFVDTREKGKGFQRRWEVPGPPEGGRGRWGLLSRAWSCGRWLRGREEKACHTGKTLRPAPVHAGGTQTPSCL